MPILIISSSPHTALLYSTSVVELLLLAADRDRAFAELSAFASLLAELRLEDPLR